ncbi:hypothetical protein Hanom_Chr17g01540691 [Helianthus anomalus]
MSNSPFSSLRFGQFCDFRPKGCFSASGSKMARFQSFWIQIRKTNLDESRKTDQTSGTKMAFYSKTKYT